MPDTNNREVSIIGKLKKKTFGADDGAEAPEEQDD